MSSFYEVTGPQTFDALWPRMERELKEFAQRLGLDPGTTDQVLSLFSASLRDNAETFNPELQQPYTPFTPSSRELFFFLGQLLFEHDATPIIGLHHVQTALDLLAAGHNLLVVQNHTSGADTLLLEHAIAQQFGVQTTDQWSYMAGHVANLYLYPLTITAAVNRVPIISSRYIGEAPEEDRPAMREQNTQACLSLLPSIQAGGCVVVLYPEGGRGENGVMKPGDPKTMKIPELMAQFSPKDLYVLPSYVEATSVLPVDRRPDELEYFIQNANRGPGHLSFSDPVLWDDLQPTSAQVDAMTDVEPKFRTKQFLIRQIMGLLQALQPAEHITVTAS